MDAKEEALRALRELLRGYEERQKIYFALTGDGSGATTADVGGRTNWTWVRYDEEQSKVSQVYNPTFPGLPEEVPVVIGKKFPTDRHVQILGINEPLYGDGLDEETRQGYMVPLHGETHNAAGADPAPIDLGNIIPGLTHQTSPASTSVEVESFRYMYKTTLQGYGGGGIELEDYEPAAAKHQYVLVSLDTSTGDLRAIGTGEVSLVTIPAMPDPIAGDIPLAIVEMLNNTDIENSYITDYRVLFQDAGNEMLEATRQMLWLDHVRDVEFTMHVVEG